MSRLRILHVLSTLDPRAGGLPAVAIRLPAAQAIAGCELHIASYYTPEVQPQIEAEIDRVPGARLIQQHFLPKQTGFGRLWASEARRTFEGLIPSFDLVHIHGVWDPIVKAAADIAARRRVPYVVAAHGMLDPWSLSQRSLKKRTALALGYRRMLNRAAFLHMLNPDEQKLIQPLGLKCATAVIPNGICLEEIEALPDPETFRASRPELNGRPYVLFLSRLHYKKGLDFLADAFQILSRTRPELRLVVAGPDTGGQRAFETLLREANLQDRVHLVGPLYGRDKFAAMVDAECFCLPSRQEGFSVAVLEAMACGTPVVISDACHFPEVTQAGAGEVVPLHSGAIAAALQHVLDDAPARKRMSQAARTLVLDNYLWPVIAERSLAQYRRVIDDHHAKSPVQA